MAGIVIGVDSFLGPGSLEVILARGEEGLAMSFCEGADGICACSGCFCILESGIWDFHAPPQASYYQGHSGTHTVNTLTTVGDWVALSGNRQ